MATFQFLQLNTGRTSRSMEGTTPIQEGHQDHPKFPYLMNIYFRVIFLIFSSKNVRTVIKIKSGVSLWPHPLFQIMDEVTQEFPWPNSIYIPFTPVVLQRVRLYLSFFLNLHWRDRLNIATHSHGCKKLNLIILYCETNDEIRI